MVWKFKFKLFKFKFKTSTIANAGLRLVILRLNQLNRHASGVCVGSTTFFCLVSIIWVIFSITVRVISLLMTTCLLLADKNPLSNSLWLVASRFKLIVRWCYDVSLILNCDNTKLFVIKSPYLIRFPTNHIVDNRLNWSKHIEYISNKLTQFVANIVILKNKLPIKVKLML